MKPIFNLGQTVATAGVVAWIAEEGTDIDVANRIARHVSGDWGEVCAEDAALNDEALELGNRVLSAYTIKGTKIWIITEWDRSVTTVLFPSEY